jgi:hypothetical protein
MAPRRSPHPLFPVGARVVLIESGAAGVVAAHVRASIDDFPSKKAHKVCWDSHGTTSYVRPGRLRLETPIAGQPIHLLDMDHPLQIAAREGPVRSGLHALKSGRVVSVSPATLHKLARVKAVELSRDEEGRLVATITDSGRLDASRGALPAPPRRPYKPRWKPPTP